MFISDYASEMEMVHHFIRYTHTHRIPISPQRSLAFLVWGYEFWMPEGGKSGGSGSIDLLASDDDGHAWLIEAKLAGNPELNSNLWSDQILKYRSALARRSHDEISLQCRNFLRNRWGDGTPVRPEITEGCTRLLDAFINWARALGKSADEGRKMYDRTMDEICNENLISAVLADDFRKDVWLNMPDDQRSYAYLTCQGRGDAFNVSCGGYILKQQEHALPEFHKAALDWASILRNRRQVKPTPDTVGQYLSKKVEPLYRDCIQRLQRLGWSGNFISNQKAFVVDLPTKYGPAIRIHLGWVDFDAPIDIESRLPGELGLKFNIDFRYFKRKAPEIGYRLARELAAQSAYIGKGAGRAIRNRELTEEEKQSWDWEMFRWAARGNQDYLGRAEEVEDFKAAWRFLDTIVATPDYRQQYSPNNLS